MIGVPYSGKSTLFTALTRTGAAGGRANQAVVPVPDPRLPILATLERSAKIVPAQVRFVDVPGGTSAQGLAALRATDALCVVLRSFGPDANPAGELGEIEADVLLADLAVVDNALENARKRLKGRGGREGEEIRALERAHAALSAETLVRDAGLDESEARFLRGLSLLTLKPWVIVANLEEGTAVPEHLPEGTVGVYAEIEAETAAMAPEEARELLDEFGVKEPGLDRVVSASYRALDLITFLDSTGLRLVLEADARARQAGRRLAIVPGPEVVHRVFLIAMLDKRLEFVDDPAALGLRDADEA